MYALSADEEFDFQLKVIMGYADGGGSNSGEILRGASQLKVGDFESFYSAFFYLAEKLHASAVNINATKFPISARDTFFRSATYYRAADFFLHGNLTDPRVYSLWDSALADFNSAIKLLPIPPERKIFKGEKFDVPIIFYKAAKGNERRPTVLVGNGYDGSQEELYHAIGKQILERGWNFATYEGPGQPTVRRNQNIGFIPQWWEAVTPVVDYLETRPDVDKSKLALTGVSYGGVLAPLAATHEHRFAAVLAIDGAYSLYQTLVDELPAFLLALYNSGNKTGFDAIMNGLRTNTSTPSSLR